MKDTTRQGFQECEICFKKILFFSALKGDVWESHRKWGFEVPKNCCKECFNSLVFDAAVSCGLKKVMKDE